MNFLFKPLGKRKQLFEIQDFSWCPQAVRDGVTDLLVLNLKIVPLYRPVLPLLKKMAAKSSGDWIDLCAGAGGGSLLLKEELPQGKLILTDLYPHVGIKLPAYAELFEKPVDARNVPSELKGFRTLFTSFHHLPDQVAHDVLKNARDARVPIGVFEFTNRNIFTILMVLPSFIFSFFLIPFIRPWQLSRYMYTYVIPLIPLVTVIDVVLSCFRTRSEMELKQVIQKLHSPDYDWEIGELSSAFGFKITYLTGLPKA